MISIEKVEIANFRSFKDKKYSKELNSFEKINVFTGENNTGKTNTLRAINLFFNPNVYVPETDMHFIKKKTGGASKHPIITLKFKDNEIIEEQVVTYSLVCDLNKSKYFYKEANIASTAHKNHLKERFSTSKKIADYLDLKFKCVYISATDEIIVDQTDKAVKDMILQYYKKQNKAVKDSIAEFEQNYKDLHSTLQANIDEIQLSMEDVFEPSKSGLKDIRPEFNIIENLDINNFLLQNLSFKIDDSYSHNIDNKGAGIQRSTLILLNIFLLEEIYHRKNKIILLDEPEAFLYPLLIEKIKENLESAVTTNKNKFQIFLTTHSSIFLSEVNNEFYSYFNLKQESESKRFARSTNETDIVKYSLVNKYNIAIKNKVLKNYGLLHQIDDYEYVVLCEGQTDYNYLQKLFEGAEITPQMRFGSHYKNKKFIGSGASSIISLLFYLNTVSNIKRKVFILLDGDNEGLEAAKKIKKESFANIEYEIKVLDSGKQIEDIVYNTEDYASKLIEISPENFCKVSKTSLIESLKVNGPESIIDRTRGFLDYHHLNLDMNFIKHHLSLNPSNIEGQSLYDEINNFLDINK